MTGLETIALTSAIAGGTTGTAGGLASIFGGDERNPSILQFNSPELEWQYIQQMQQQIQLLNQQYSQVGALYDTMQQRFQIQRDYLNGIIPKQDALQALTAQDLQIAQTYGQKTLEQLGQGFLDEEDRARSQELQSAAEEEYKNLSRTANENDPIVEAQLKDAETQLRQGLAQQLGPGYETTTAGQMALQQFNRYSTEAKFSSRQDLLDRSHQRAIQRVGLLGSGLETALKMRLASRSQGLAETQFLDNARRASLEGARTAAFSGNQLLTGLNQGEFEQGLAGIKTQAGLLGEQRDIQRMYGTTNFGRTSRRALETGVLGPGSIYQQTGGKFTPSTLADYTNYLEQSNNASAQGYLNAQPGFGYGALGNVTYNKVGLSGPTVKPKSYLTKGGYA